MYMYFIVHAFPCQDTRQFRASLARVLDMTAMDGSLERALRESQARTPHLEFGNDVLCLNSIYIF